MGSCLSLDSYIKPQLTQFHIIRLLVVYLLIPTSNHNNNKNGAAHLSVVYLLIPTSNHNPFLDYFSHVIVVYLLIPTSNHNLSAVWMLSVDVVYLLIPTSNHNFKTLIPIVWMLFISWFLHQTTTALVIKINYMGCLSLDSYIKPQLYGTYFVKSVRCLSLDSYIKPQLIHGFRIFL